MPDRTAQTFPAGLPAETLSRKKHRMPAKTAAAVIRSRRVGRTRNSTAMNKMIHTGAVYCRMMVLAAVVSLLATTYSVVMANVLTAPSSTVRFQISR